MLKISCGYNSMAVITAFYDNWGTALTRHLSLGLLSVPVHPSPPLPPPPKKIKNKKLSASIVTIMQEDLIQLQCLSPIIRLFEMTGLYKIGHVTLIFIVFHTFNKVLTCILHFLLRYWEQELISNAIPLRQIIQ